MTDGKIQLCFIAYLGIQESVGFHGGGVHQWNVRYQDVQYNFKVSGVSRKSALRVCVCF